MVIEVRVQEVVRYLRVQVASVSLGLIGSSSYGSRVDDFRACLRI